jgi:hypothetical protein
MNDIESKKIKLELLEHDFKGNIRNQISIYENVLEMMKENEKVDNQYFHFINETRKKTNILWDQLIELMENYTEK